MGGQDQVMGGRQGQQDRAMAETLRGRRDPAMEVEEEEDDPRDVLRVDLVPTMEDKVVGNSSRRKGAAKCLDRPVFSTCFQLLTWQQRHLRLVHKIATK